MRQLLVLIHRELQLYRRDGDDWRCVEQFSDDERGRQGLARHLGEYPRAEFYLLLDCAEEWLGVEATPRLSRRESELWIQHRLQQHLPEVARIVLDRAGPGRHSVVAAMPESPYLQKWCAVLQEQQASLLGVASLPLLLGRDQKQRQSDLLVLALGRQQYRLLYMAEGQARLSRRIVALDDSQLNEEIGRTLAFVQQQLHGTEQAPEVVELSLSRLWAMVGSGVADNHYASATQLAVWRQRAINSVWQKGLCWLAACCLLTSLMLAAASTSFGASLIQLQQGLQGMVQVKRELERQAPPRPRMARLVASVESLEALPGQELAAWLRGVDEFFEMHKAARLLRLAWHTESALRFELELQDAGRSQSQLVQVVNATVPGSVVHVESLGRGHYRLELRP